MTWDEYYHGICQAVGANSKCLSRQIGSILVRDRVIICTGYNGPPRGIPHCTDRCPRQAEGYKSGEGLHLCRAAHSERNCLIQAARLGIATRGATIYMNCGVPCKDCLIEIINSGVKELVITEFKFYDALSVEVYGNSDLSIRLFDHLEEE